MSAVDDYLVLVEVGGRYDVLRLEFDYFGLDGIREEVVAEIRGQVGGAVGAEERVNVPDPFLGSADKVGIGADFGMIQSFYVRFFYKILILLPKYSKIIIYLCISLILSRIHIYMEKAK